jgi:hypothetical protein
VANSNAVVPGFLDKDDIYGQVRGKKSMHDGIAAMHVDTHYSELRHGWVLCQRLQGVPGCKTWHSLDRLGIGNHALFVYS